MQIGHNFRIMKYVKFNFSTSQKQSDRFDTTHNGSPLKTEISNKKPTKKNKKQTNPRLNCSLKKQAGEPHTETRMEVGKHAGIYL